MVVCERKTESINVVHIVVVFVISSVVGGGRRLIFNLFGSFSFPCSVRNRVSSIISHYFSLSHGPEVLWTWSISRSIFLRSTAFANCFLWEVLGMRCSWSSQSFIVIVGCKAHRGVNKLFFTRSTGGSRQIHQVNNTSVLNRRDYENCRKRIFSLEAILIISGCSTTAKAQSTGATFEKCLWSVCKM